MSIKPKSLFYVSTSGVPTQHIVKALISELSTGCNAGHQLPGGPKLKVLCGVEVEVNGYAMLGPGISVSPVCAKCQQREGITPRSKLFQGENELNLTTSTEMLLFAALKAVLFAHGGPPSINYVIKEFQLNRFAFIDALDHHVGFIQIATDGNNGRDLVRLVK